MKQELIDHIHDLTVPPVLDVLGQWVHLRNPRVATTSMDEGPLRDRCIIKYRGRKNWEVVWNQVIVPKIDDLVLFTFVRNPWDRICSAFFQCRDRARNTTHKIDKAWQFTDWVKQVLAVRGPGLNMHFAPQYDSVCRNGDRIPNVFVGRFERMQADWSALAAQIGVSPGLPHLNPCGKKYADHYDDESWEIVGEMYAQEIKALGYGFG